MITTQVRNLYLEAIEKWGDEAQLDKAIEECAELILAIQHRKIHRATNEHVIEEVADVQILMDQLSIIFNEDAVADMKVKKLDKLRRKVLEL